MTNTLVFEIMKTVNIWKRLNIMDKSVKRKRYSNVEAVDVIHQVADLYTSTKTPKDYGTGEDYTSAEVHTLKYIAEHEGITVTQLSIDYAKTKSAISQLLKKIESKGLIYRENDLGRDTRQFIYLTDKGKELDRVHRAYDEQHFSESIDKVRAKFTEDEMDTAFCVLEQWLEVRRELQKRRNHEEKLKKRKRTRTME